MPLPFHSQIQSSVPTGTAPLSIVSTTLVDNLNADLLDGQHGSFYQNAGNLNAGTIPTGRLSGAYPIDITGYAAAVAVSDTRSVATTPQTINRGVVFDFKENSSNGLNDGGNYFGLMTFRQYGVNTDWSGGSSHQLGFTDNGNVWQRSGSDTTWGSWKKLWDDANDGAGSGLDADLLDGQHGSYYQNAGNLNAGTLPADRMPGHTGDVTSAAGSVALTLANSGVTAGTYKSVTVDAKGRVTAGTNPTTLSGYGITDAMYQVDPGGFTQGDIYGSGNMQRLWGTDSVQNLIAFRPPTTVEYTVDGVNWVATTISNDVFDGKVFGKWAGFNMNVGANVGGWTKVRMTWVNFGYHFFSHFTLCHSTNGHSMNFVFYKSDLNGVFGAESYRVNGINSWPGYTFTSHVNVSGWWDTKDVRMEFELIGNNGPAGYPNNAITIGHIGIMGGYASFNRVFDWDGSRNITLYGNLTLPGNVSATGTVSGSSFTGAGTGLTGTANGLNVGGYSARWATARTISLTGDVTGTSGGFDGTANLSFAVSIANSAVTYAKIQNVAAASVIGNSSASVAQAPTGLSMATLAGMLSDQTMNIAGSSTSCTGNAATATNVAWSGVTGKPTTLSGYGITDALPLTGGTITGTALQVGTAFTYDNPGGWNANIVAAGTYHARFRLRATSYNSSGDRQTFMWLDNTVTPSTGIYSDATVFNFDGSINTLRIGGQNVLHAGNYNSYAPTLTGTGASGTWNINISGSAVSATTQSKSDSSTSIATTAFAKWLFATSGTGGTTDWNDVSNTMPGTGTTLLLGSATNGFGPSQYYHPVNFEYAGTGGTGNVTQLAVAYGDYGNDLRMRGRYSGTWTSWVQFLNSSNYSSYALPITGGTLTGALSGTSASFSGALSSGGNSVLTVGNYSSYAVDNTKRVKQFFWDSLSASTTQARRFEIARIAIDTTNWNTTGSFEVEVSEAYWGRGLLKKYVVFYGYGGPPRSGVALVQMSGAGDNNFRVVVGSEIFLTGNNYYVPVYVDVRHYTIAAVRVTTSRLITSSATPPIGYTYINPSPTPTNITDFTGDSTVDLSSAASAWQVAGNTLLHSANYTSYAPTLTGTGATGTWDIDISGEAGSVPWYGVLSKPTTLAGYGITDALPLTGGTLTGNLSLSAATLLNMGQQARIQFNYSNLQTVDWGSDRAGWLWNAYYDWSGTPAYRFWATNTQGAAMLHMSPTQLTFYTKAGPSTQNASFSWDVGHALLHAGNYNSYAPTLTGTGASGSWAISVTGSSASCTGNAATATNASQLNGQAASFYQNAGNLNAGTLLAARLPAFTGDATSTAGTSALTLANSGVTAGTYNNVTVNAKGLVTGGSNVSYLTGNQSITLSGDVSGSGTTAITATIGAGAVTYAKIQNVATSSVLGNSSASVAQAPQALSMDTLAGMLSGKAMNIAGSSTSCTGNAATATNVSWSGITSKPTTFSGYGISDIAYGSTGSRNVWTITDWNQATYQNAHFLSSENTHTNGPTSDYIYGLQTSFHRSGAAYRTQMVTELYGSPVSIWVRNSRDSDVWTTWSKLLHSNNYTDYAPTKTGSGASGSWGINITGSSASCTGNAATATTATNSTQLNGQAASYYENRDTTAVSISAGILTLTRAAGNLTATIGGRVVAWCEFSGNFASSQSPNAAFNVSSIIKNAAGDYTVNFTSALANANYVVSGTAQLDAPSPGQSVNNVFVAVPRRSGAKATGSCRIVCEYPYALSLWDCGSVGVAFIAA